MIKTSYEIADLRKIKWEYYNGKMSQEELDKRGWEPFRFVLKTDISTYMDADPDMVKLQQKKSYHEETVAVCASIMKELGNRTYQLRDHMTHERFIGGGH
jgi:hypothetical protein